MPQSQGLLEIIFIPVMLFCSGQSLVSIVLLLKNREKQYSNNLLVIWCALWGSACYFFFVYLMGTNYLVFPVLVWVTPAIPILLFPPLYLYIKYFCLHIEKIAIKDYLHYLPVFIYIVFTLLLYFYAGSMDELPRLDVYRYRNRVLLYTATIQGFVYFFLSYKLIKKQEIKLKQEFSNAEKIRLYWLKHLNYLVLSVMFFGTMSTLFQSFSINPYPFYILYHLFIGISLYYISFQIILKPVLFSGEIPNPCLTKIPENKAQVDRSIVYKLEEVMDTLKLYINQDLSLQELSDVLNISRNQLSYVLNNYIQQNFYDYIQLLRLNECKKRLLDPKYAHLSIISIAYDSGFNSKTVFYRTFKKYEKMTPTEFQSKFLKVNN